MLVFSVPHAVCLTRPGWACLHDRILAACSLVCAPTCLHISSTVGACKPHFLLLTADGTYHCSWIPLARMGILRRCQRRLRRSSMMTRTGIPPGGPLIVVAAHPTVFGRLDQIQVDLLSLKQGTFNDQPASFLLFEINQSMRKHACHLSYDFEFSSAPAHPTGLLSSTERSFSLVAYGPAHVFEPSHTSPSSTSPSHLPPTVDMQRTPKGLTVSINKSDLADNLPDRMRVALVVAHTDSLVLTVFPSFSLLAHILSFRRNLVFPLSLDLAVEYRAVSTCARAEQDCHPTCSDFGHEHATPEFWMRTLACSGLRGYMGNPTPHVSPFACRGATSLMVIQWVEYRPW